MANSNVLFNACCYRGSYLPTNTTCCDAGGEEESHRAQERGVVGVAVFSLFVFVLCSLAIINARCREKKNALAQLEKDVASQESKEERRRKRKESILNGLIVKEWVVPDGPLVEMTERDQDTPPTPPAPPINSTSPASCVMGSDDCESLAGEEDMAGCAICLSPFKSQQLVCESNNSSCQHVFHKDCMVDWLMKHHDSCPMCREVYLLRTL
jgi:hypothetical protein